MFLPKFTEYEVDENGKATLVVDPADPPPAGLPPQIHPHIVPIVIKHLPLLKQLELLEPSDSYRRSILRVLRETKVMKIMLSPEECDTRVRLNISFAGKEGLTIEFKGVNDTITMASLTAAFDHLLKVLSYVDCSEVEIDIAPHRFPVNLDLVELPSRHLPEGQVLVKELTWGFGAPLQLYVQLRPEKLLIDISRSDSRNGAADIADRIRQHNIVHF